MAKCLISRLGLVAALAIAVTLQPLSTPTFADQARSECKRGCKQTAEMCKQECRSNCDTLFPNDGKSRSACRKPCERSCRDARKACKRECREPETREEP